MYFLKHFKSFQQDNVSVPDYYAEFERLRRLENTVCHYGGGRAQLETRAAERAVTLRALEPLTAALLDDIARYLRDIAQAGKLNCSGRGE